MLTVFVLCFSGCSGNSKKNKNNTKNDTDDEVFIGVMGTVSTNQSTSKKRVALTFDDGPHTTRTIAIVDELDKYGFHATFFVVGNRVDGSEYNGAKAMKYAADHGNEIGIHGYTHSSSAYYDKCDDTTYKSEISKTEQAIKSVLPNAKIRLMRPTGGRITEERIKSSKYSIIMWGVDSKDYEYRYVRNSDDTVEEKREKQEKLDTIVNNVMSSVQDGSIILMHDIYESTYEATAEILKRLHKEGYEVVTVSELLGDQMSAGKRYSKK